MVSRFALKLEAFPCSRGLRAVFDMFFISFVLIFLQPTFDFGEAVINHSVYNGQHRPQFHFSPATSWLNDPNGLFTYRNRHHMFYQYYPDGLKWGPMHWGHAISNDWLHWTEVDIAVYPDKNGLAFSGSGVVDEKNVSGLQETVDNKAIILMYTRFRRELEEQYISFSVDGGTTWRTKDEPVIKSPDPSNKHFRDPKMFMYDGQYYVAIARRDEAFFYESKNLLSWNKVSQFGAQYATSDLWECPDLIKLQLNNQSFSVLVISLNTAGRSDRYLTQYFVGTFDQKRFTIRQVSQPTLWLDHGPDCYAGVTWFGTNRYICWMTNWRYASETPTFPWRGQMSIPRDMHLVAVGSNIYVASMPVDLQSLRVKDESTHGENRGPVNIRPGLPYVAENLTHNTWEIHLTFDLTKVLPNDHIEFCSFNYLYEKICVKYFKSNDSYLMDRSRSGDITFSQYFPLYWSGRRLTQSKISNWTILLDVSSIELFADGGLTTMTALFFPSVKFNSFSIELTSTGANSTLILNHANFYALRSIWK